MNNYFPNPAAQAMSLLDETGDDLQIALALALMNARQKDIEIDRYWVAVANVLTREEQEN